MTSVMRFSNLQPKKKREKYARSLAFTCSGESAEVRAQAVGIACLFHMSFDCHFVLRVAQIQQHLIQFPSGNGGAFPFSLIKHHH